MMFCGYDLDEEYKFFVISKFSSIFYFTKYNTFDNLNNINSKI
jgi:hypothetical protein